MQTKNIIKDVFRWMEYAGCAIIAILVIAVVLNVISRQLGYPLFGITELVQYGTLAAISLAAANTTYLRSHPSVGILVDAFGVRGKAIASIITDLISAAILGYIGWNLLPAAIKEFQGFRTTESLFIPYWIINALILFCIFSVMLCLLILTVFDIQTAVNPKAAEEAKKELSLEGACAIAEAEEHLKSMEYDVKEEE